MVDLGVFDFLILFAFLLIIILWIRSRRPTGCPPGPTTIPVIGNMHNIAKGHVLETFREMRMKYGDIFSLSLGQFWVIVVNGTENLRDLLVKNGEYTSDRPPLFFMELFMKKGNFWFLLVCLFLCTARDIIYFSVCPFVRSFVRVASQCSSCSFNLI